MTVPGRAIAQGFGTAQETGIGSVAVETEIGLGIVGIDQGPEIAHESVLVHEIATAQETDTIVAEASGRIAVVDPKTSRSNSPRKSFPGSRRRL